MQRPDLPRLRWRLRGAWQWPTFGLLTLAEAILLNRLPVWGNGPGGFFPGLLLAGCLNLIVVAVLAPLVARLVRPRPRDLPRSAPPPPPPCRGPSPPTTPAPCCSARSRSRWWPGASPTAPR